MENKKLKRKIIELDEKTSTLHRTRSSPQKNHHAFLTKVGSQITRISLLYDNPLLKNLILINEVQDDELTKRLAHSKMLLSRVNDNIAHYRIPSGSSSHHRSGGPGNEI